MAAWITKVQYQGDAVEARNLIVQVLADAGFIDVRTTTVEAWMDEQMNKPPAPMSHKPGHSAEHSFEFVWRSKGARPNA